MKRDFLLGGTKLPTGGAVRGAGGAMSPPVFMLKEALLRYMTVYIVKIKIHENSYVEPKSYDMPGKNVVFPEN